MGRKLGAVRGSWIHIYNTMWPGPRPTSVPNGILIMGRNGAVAVPLSGRRAAAPHLTHSLALTEAYVHNKWHLES